MTDPARITVEQLAKAVQLAINSSSSMVGIYTLRVPGWSAATQAHLQVDVEHSSGVVVQTFIIDIEEDH